MNGRHRSARTATLAIGGTIAGLAILGVGFGGAAALAVPDQSAMLQTIPDEVRSVVIDTEFTNVQVNDGNDGGGHSFAYLDERSSTLFGSAPRVEVETSGTTATIRIVDEAQQNRFGIGAATLYINLRHTALDSLTIRGGGWGYIDAADSSRLVVDTEAGVDIDLSSGRTEDVALSGSGTYRLMTSEADEWRIVEPEWYDAWVTQQLGPDASSCMPYDHEAAICIPSISTADHAIDFSGIDKGARVSIHSQD